MISYQEPGLWRARLAKRALVAILRRGKAVPQDDIVQVRRSSWRRRVRPGEKSARFRKRPLQPRDTGGRLCYPATKPQRGLALESLRERSLRELRFT
jgi:hypothetical protein